MLPGRSRLSGTRARVDTARVRRCAWLTAMTAAPAGPVALPAAACTYAGDVPEAKRFAVSVQRRYEGRIGRVWGRTVRDGAACGPTTSEAAIRAVVRRHDRDRSARAAAALLPACRTSA